MAVNELFASQVFANFEFKSGSDELSGVTMIGCTEALKYQGTSHLCRHKTMDHASFRDHPELKPLFTVHPQSFQSSKSGNIEQRPHSSGKTRIVNQVLLVKVGDVNSYPHVFRKVLPARHLNSSIILASLTV